MNRFASRALGSLAASRAARGASLLVLAALAATSQLLGGCTGDLVIVDPSGGGGGSGVTSGAPSTATSGTPGDTSTAMSSAATTGTTGGGGAGGGPGGSSNIAIFNEQLSSNDKPAWLSEGEKLDYVTLIIGISFGRAQSCNGLLFDLSSDTSYRQLIFGLSLSVQKVGKYNLASTDVIAAYQYWVTDGTGNSGGETHPLTEGTIEVLSIDSKTFKVRVAQLPGDLNGLDGDYGGTRCPPLE